MPSPTAHNLLFISAGMETNPLSANQGEARHEAEPHASYVAERVCNARPTAQARASRACYGEHHPTAWRGVCSLCTHRDRPHSHDAAILWMIHQKHRLVAEVDEDLPVGRVLVGWPTIDCCWLAALAESASGEAPP